MMYLHMNMCTFFLQIPMLLPSGRPLFELKDLTWFVDKSGCDGPQGNLHMAYQSTVFRHIAGWWKTINFTQNLWGDVATLGNPKQLVSRRMQFCEARFVTFTVWETFSEPNTPKYTMLYLHFGCTHLRKEKHNKTSYPTPPQIKKSSLSKRKNKKPSTKKTCCWSLLCSRFWVGVPGIRFSKDFFGTNIQRCSGMPRPRNAVGRPTRRSQQDGSWDHFFSFRRGQKPKKSKVKVWCWCFLIKKRLIMFILY